MIPGADQNRTGSWIKDSGREFQPGKEIPATEESKKWEGWGTALKPAWEPIVLAMKPVDGTFAKNALKHGVAGVCIDGARISTNESLSCSKSDPFHAADGSQRTWNPTSTKGMEREQHPEGRWPANVVLQHHQDCVLKGTKKVKAGDSNRGVIHGTGTGVTYLSKKERSKHYADADGLETVEDWDCHPECPIRIVDDQSGESVSSGGGGAREHGAAPGGIYGVFGAKDYPENVGKGDVGGASRFFYCAKASKSERGPENNHPTVKPIDLMKWLVSLVKMPEENLILDPFSGSGTTGFACEILRIPFIGFEKDEKWARVSNRRIRSVTYGDVSVKEHQAGQRSLFEGVDDE
jgi:site-specific DNA-methyltransferase (adenine-specific)